MKNVRVVNVDGYNKGEVVSMTESAAETYLANGQVEEVSKTAGAMKSPVNRMVDTSGDSTGVKTKRAK